MTGLVTLNIFSIVLLIIVVLKSLNDTLDSITNKHNIQFIRSALLQHIEMSNKSTVAILNALEKALEQNEQLGEAILLSNQVTTEQLIKLNEVQLTALGITKENLHAHLDDIFQNLNITTEKQYNDVVVEYVKEEIA